MAALDIKLQQLQEQDNVEINVKKPKSNFSKLQKVILVINALIVCISIILSVCFLSKLKNHIGSADERDTILSVYYECDHEELKFLLTHWSDYWLMQNAYIGGDVRNVGCADHVTYVTQGSDLNFFPHLIELIKSWQAPVSAALYAPGSDFDSTMTAIQYVRTCIPEAELIRKFVTFHVFFPFEHSPTSLPHSEEEALNWHVNCKKSPYDQVEHTQTYVYKHNLSYPVNIARNIARTAANTHFVLMSDVIYKPTEISRAFIANQLEEKCPLIDKKRQCKIKDDRQTAYLLPVYAFNKQASIPKTKRELSLLKSDDVLLENTEFPIFIATTYQPIYDERFFWDSKWHKNPQYYAMCLQHYNFEAYNQEDAFVIYYRDKQQTTKGIPNGQEYLDTARSMLDETLLLEYPVLFGHSYAKECQPCLKTPQKCH